MAEAKKTTEKVETKVVDMDELVEVEIPIMDGNEDDVYVGLNGHCFLIKRGYPVKVPRYIKEVLDNKSRMEREARDRRNNTYAHREVK